MKWVRITVPVALALALGVWLGASQIGGSRSSKPTQLQPAAAVADAPPSTVALPAPQAPVVITNPDGTTTVIDSGPGGVSVQSSGPNGNSQYQSQNKPGTQTQIGKGQYQSQTQSGHGSQSQSQYQSR